MRTYASLLRDKDFAATLHQEIAKEKSSKDFEVKTDPIEDARNHTDVLVKTGDKIYRIWLFQYTRMGLPHDIERITGERGALPRGVHILCPLKSGEAMDYSNASGAISKIELKLLELEVRTKEGKGKTKELKKLEATKERLGGRLAKLESKRESLSKQLTGEVEVCEGWYFYPSQKVREVLQMIKRISNGEQTPEKYANVCKVLNLPKEHLSHISSFEI
jgi:cell division protein FtsB